MRHFGVASSRPDGMTPSKRSEPGAVDIRCQKATGGKEAGMQETGDQRLRHVAGPDESYRSIGQHGGNYTVGI